MDTITPATAATALSLTDKTAGIGISITDTSGALVTKDVKVGGGHLLLNSTTTNDWNWHATDHHSTITISNKLPTFALDASTRAARANVTFSKLARFYFDVHFTLSSPGGVSGKQVGIHDDSVAFTWTNSTSGSGSGFYSWQAVNPSFMNVYLNAANQGNFGTDWNTIMCGENDM